MIARNLILLVAANLFWAANPTAAKILIAEVGNAQTAWLKYFSALLAFLIIWPWLGRLSAKTFKPFNRRDFLVVLIIGLTTCFLSPLCQMQGLSASSAVNNSLLMAMEPLFTVVLAYFILREAVTRRDLLALAAAIAGSLILSGFFSAADAGQWAVSWSRGDLILLVAILCEACYSVFSKKIAQRYSGLQIFGAALLIGFALQTIVVFRLFGRPRIELLSTSGWLALLWLGPLGTAFTYLAWIKVIERGVPLSAMVVTIFLQPVAGATAAAFILHEPVRSYQLAGGAMILAAVAWEALSARSFSSAS